jgi:hypothetical protein
MVIAALLTFGNIVAPPDSPVAPSAAEATTLTRVCAPNGHCVVTTRYCPPGSACGAQTYRLAGTYEYCSSSVGCVYWKGRNYFYLSGPKPTAAQQLKIQQCAAGLGFTWLTTVAGGPVGFTIAGVALGIWGCAS